MQLEDLSTQKWGEQIEGSGRGIGSRSRREGWVAATHSDSEPGFP